MQPGEYYIMGIVITALFVAPFSALARVVVLSWLIARGMWMAGLPEQIANIGGQGSVFLLGMRRIDGNAQLFAWFLSLPIVLVSIAWFGGLIDPVACWWSILALAMVQLVALPWAIAGETYHAVLKAWRETVDEGFFRSVHR